MEITLVFSFEIIQNIYKMLEIFLLLSSSLTLSITSLTSVLISFLPSF